MQLYNQNHSLVDSIVQGKIDKGEYKVHPDCPEEEDAMLYYCMIDLSNLQEDRTEERIDVTADISMELGSEA